MTINTRTINVFVALLLICGLAVGDWDDITPLRGYKKQEDRCQTVNFLSKTDFDLDTYIQRTWFIQKQQVNPYQGLDNLFCVTATYNKRPDGRIQVLNAAREGSVTGTARPGMMTSAFGQLCAEQIFAGRIRVGPCILGFASDLIYGPYWVIAAKYDEVARDYSWGIVSAGAPDVFIERKGGKNFCTTSNSTCFLDFNGTGLWLFTRERVASKETIDEMEQVLKSMGIYTGGLRDVQQEGCTYPSTIKL